MEQDYDTYKLMEVIQATIAPDSGMVMGDGPGNITEYRGMLVISQTLDVQRDVEELLDALREAIAE